MTEIGYRRTGPADGPDMEAAAEKLRSLGASILCAARDELYFSMRFLDVALSRAGGIANTLSMQKMELF